MFYFSTLFSIFQRQLSPFGSVACVAVAVCREKIMNAKAERSKVKFICYFVLPNIQYFVMLNDKKNIENSYSICLIHEDSSRMYGGQNPPESLRPPRALGVSLDVEARAEAMKLKNNKVLRTDMVSTELLKNDGETFEEQLHLQIVFDWKTEKIINRWIESIMLPLNKNRNKM